MSKKLRFLFFIICTISICLILIFLIFKDINKIENGNGLLNLVPDNFISIVKFNKISNYNKLIEKDSTFINNFLYLYNLKKCHIAINKFINNEKLLNYKENFYLSLHPQGKNDVSIVVYLPVNVNLTENRILKIFENFKINTKTYDKNKFYELRDLSSNILIYLFYFNGFAILSNDLLLIETIIRNKNSQTNKNFYDLFKLSKSKSSYANVLINFDNFYFLARKLINHNYLNKFILSKKIAKYGVLDFNVNNNILILNGFLIPDKEKNDLISLFTENIDFKTTQLNLIPYGADQIVHFSFNSIDDFYQKLSKTRKKNFIEKLNNFKKEIKENNSYSLDEDFIKYIDNEVTLFFAAGKPYLLLKVKNFDDFKIKFLRFAEKTNKKQFSKSLKINEIIYNIYELGINNFIEIIFGDFFNAFRNLYFTFYDDNIIFSDSDESLREYLLNINKNNLFYNYPPNQKIKKLIPSDGNFIYYVDFGMNKTINKYFIKPSKEEDKFFCVTLKNEDEKILVSFVSGFKDQTELPVILWKLKLDSPIKTMPYVVKNHNTGEEELILQDDDCNLYLINQSGNIIWKKKIEEPVISKFYQVDFYKNNKLQLLFNSHNYIYLIDRNGNSVENFPIKLPAKATNGLSVFDYENNKEYRIFIACSDKRVYAYNLKGKLIDGWKIPVTKNYIISEVQHFRISTKDYICFKDSFRMYVFDRRGNPRFNFNENIVFSDNCFYLYSNGFDNVVFTDIKGNLYSINFERGYKVLNYDTFSSNHLFMVDDFNGDRNGDLIFIDENRMVVYNNKEEKIFEREFDFKIDNKPVIFGVNNYKAKVICIKLINGDLYIFDNNNTTLKGFPIKDCEKFIISKFNKEEKYFNLIVAKNDNFLYNYIIKF